FDGGEERAASRPGLANATWLRTYGRSRSATALPRRSLSPRFVSSATHQNHTPLPGASRLVAVHRGSWHCRLLRPPTKVGYASIRAFVLRYSGVTRGSEIPSGR